MCERGYHLDWCDKWEGIREKLGHFAVFGLFAASFVSFGVALFTPNPAIQILLVFLGLLMEAVALGVELSDGDIDGASDSNNTFTWKSTLMLGSAYMLTTLFAIMILMGAVHQANR